MGLGKSPCVFPQHSPFFWVCKQLTNPIGKFRWVKEVNQQARCVVLDSLVQGGGIAGDNRTTCAHGFQ